MNESCITTINTDSQRSGKLETGDNRLSSFWRECTQSIYTNHRCHCECKMIKTKERICSGIHQTAYPLYSVESQRANCASIIDGTARRQTKGSSPCRFLIHCTGRGKQLENILIIKHDMSSFTWLLPCISVDSDAAVSKLLRCISCFRGTDRLVTDQRSHLRTSLMK